MKLRVGLFIVVAPVLLAGCGGIRATKSVSPLDFILPGLLENSPTPPTIPAFTNTASLLAGDSAVAPAHNCLLTR